MYRKEPIVEGDLGQINRDNGVWLTVGLCSVRVFHAKEGVVVDIYDNDPRVTDSLSSQTLWFDELEFYTESEYYKEE